MIEELVQLKLKYNLGHLTESEIREGLIKIIDRNTFFITMNAEQTQIIGYLEYDLTYDHIIQVRDLICTAPGAIWKLRTQLRRLDYTRMFFKRWKTGQWIHRGRICHV